MTLDRLPRTSNIPLYQGNKLSVGSACISFFAVSCARSMPALLRTMMLQSLQPAPIMPT